MPRFEVHHEPDTPRSKIAPGVTIPVEFAVSCAVADTPLTATVHMRVQNGGAVCVRAEVARDDGKELTARDVHGIRFGELIAAAPQAAANNGRSPSDYVTAEVARAHARRTGAPGYVIDAELAEVARTYRDALREGRSPTKAVKAAFQVSDRTASRLVSRARKAGYLGAAPDRRAGEIAALSGTAAGSGSVAGDLSADPPGQE